VHLAARDRTGVAIAKPKTPFVRVDELGDQISGNAWRAFHIRGVLGVTVRLMSDGELMRLGVLRGLDQRRLTTEAAAQLLGLERRQVFRLLKAYRTAGPAGLISKRRGRRSNRRKPAALRRAVLAMIREWY